MASSQVGAAPNIGDIIFYVLLAALVVIVVVLCFLFTKSKKFKLKEEIKAQLENKPYEPPQIIKVEQKEVKKLEDIDNF
ncbi:MAG: hypothetical protein RR348_01120 [Clostridia bacterium]